jgi:hypothetical protein
LARGRYRRHKKRSGDSSSVDTAEVGSQKSFSSEIALVFKDRKQAITDWRELLNLAIHTQGLQQAADDSQRVATVQVVTDKPFCFIYSGDWHLGDGRTDHCQWQHDIDLVLNHPRIKIVNLGDSHQNMRSFKTLSAVLSQALSPPMQAKMMKGIVDELAEKNKVAAWVDGNHDAEFDERIFGEALQYYYLQTMKAPRFRNRGVLKIEVVNPNSSQITQSYTNLLFHKSRFSSFMRAVHGAYREYQLSFPADVVAGAHDHVPGFELIYHYTLARDAGLAVGGESFLIKCGTYQDSDFGWKYFHNGGFPWNAAVIYWPAEHKKLFMPSICEAINYLDYLGN